MTTVEAGLGRSRRLTLNGRLVMPVLVLASFAAAFAQRPGDEYVDSRIDLAVDPSRFLERIWQVWSGTGDLGHVHSGQSVGYLLPMGPWYALADWLGVPMWIAQRIWLGALYALAAWGAVRLMDLLYRRERGPAHLVAGAIFAFNPYVATWTDRATVALLAYAALPWLMIFAHRALRSPGAWRWPAAAALLLAVTGGGVNATLIVVLLPAPAALLLYETWVLGRPGAAAWAFAWRTAVLGIPVSLWWLIPLVLAAPYGGDFLSFTEQPVGIWTTNAMSESLRLLGYWPMYLRIGSESQSVFDFVGSYFTSLPVIAGSFVVPLAALAGLRWTGRWSYAPFFGLLAIFGLVIMSAGFPRGAPGHDALLWLYYSFEPLQVLRTTYKAAPLVALSLAVLAGAAVDALLAAARQPWSIDRRLSIAALVVFAIGMVVFAWPQLTGNAVDQRSAYGRIPGSWPAAVVDAERATDDNQRILQLPGQLFGAYGWGGEVNEPVAPALTDRPVAVRSITRYSDPRSAQLLASVDDLVQQARLLPGQLDPLLRLMGVGQVLVGADANGSIAGSATPAAVERALAEQDSLRLPAAAYGRQRLRPPELGRSDLAVAVPDVRRYDAPAGFKQGIVRVHPATGATVLDGDADGVVDLAGLGGLDTGRALFYAADLDPGRLRRLVESGGRLVFSDSNRKRTVSPSRFVDLYGPTLTASATIADAWPDYDPFPARGPAGQTVAVYSGLRRLEAPTDLGLSSFPEHGATAAFDGRLDTSWLASNYSPSERRYLEFELPRARRLPFIAVYPHAGTVGRTRTMALSVDGGEEREVALRRAWTTIRLGPQPVRTVRLRVKDVATLYGAPGGLAEVRIPGVRVREALRMPTTLAHAARGADLNRSEIWVVARRTTADDPYRTGLTRADPQAENRQDMVDPERGIERIVTLPQARSFGVDGWASVGDDTPDDAIDRLAGVSDEWRMWSSSRFENVPSRRASSALDGRPSTDWVADRTEDHRPWLAWRGPQRLRIAKLRLVRSRAGYPFPSRLRIHTQDAMRDVPVGADGTVRLETPLRDVRGLTLEVLETRPGGGSAAFTRAVGIAEVVIPGLDPPSPRRTGSFATRCGEIVVSAARSRATMSVADRMTRLDDGLPLRLRPCGNRAELSLTSGANPLSAPPGEVMRPDHLRLVSKPPSGRPEAPSLPGTVGTPGEMNAAGIPQDVPLELENPAWLVLGTSYAPGWRATCRTRDGEPTDLGAPLPADGFANGWRVPVECAVVRFRFGPQRIAIAFFIISWIALLVLAALLATGVVRDRRRARIPPAEGDADDIALQVPAADPLVRTRAGVALAAGAAVGIVAAGVFALRFGVVLGPATTVLLLLGVNVRRLLAIATVALLAVVVIYVADPAPEFIGVRFFFAEAHLFEHWLTVGAACCVAAACALSLVRLRAARTASATAASTSIVSSTGWRKRGRP